MRTFPKFIGPLEVIDNIRKSMKQQHPVTILKISIPVPREALILFPSPAKSV